MEHQTEKFKLSPLRIERVSAWNLGSGAFLCLIAQRIRNPSFTVIEPLMHTERRKVEMIDQQGIIKHKGIKKQQPKLYTSKHVQPWETTTYERDRWPDSNRRQPVRVVVFRTLHTPIPPVEFPVVDVERWILWFQIQFSCPFPLTLWLSPVGSELHSTLGIPPAVSEDCILAPEFPS